MSCIPLFHQIRKYDGNRIIFIKQVSEDDGLGAHSQEARHLHWFHPDDGVHRIHDYN